MANEEIFYTDGQDVVVTTSALQVKDRFYRLRAIRRHSMAIMQPARLPGILLFVTGVALAIIGMASGFNNSIPGDYTWNGEPLSQNVAALWGGTILAFAGLGLTLAMKEKYAVKIATDDGEKMAVVSSKREQITEIVDALNRAFMTLDIERRVASRSRL